MAKPRPWTKSGVPAKEARRHLRKMRTMGVPQAILATTCGLSERHTNAILNGKVKYLKPATFDAVMAVGLSAIETAKSGKIDSKQSAHLIEEILEAGYSKGWIARQLGLKINSFQLSPTITIARANRIKEIHDRLWKENEVGWQVKAKYGQPIYGKTFREVCTCYGVSDLERKREIARIRQRDFRARNDDEALYA